MIEKEYGDEQLIYAIVMFNSEQKEQKGMDEKWDS